MRTEQPNFNCVLAGTISKFENKPIIYRLDEAANILFYIPEGDLRRVLGPDHASTASAGYDVACVLAPGGRRNEALALLRAAVAHGLPADTALQIEKDSDLKSLHGDPRFDSLVASTKQISALAAANN